MEHFALVDQIVHLFEGEASLPELARSLARVLDCSLSLLDRDQVLLATAARSSHEERQLLEQSDGVIRYELKIAANNVGFLDLFQSRSAPAIERPVRRLVCLLFAGELARLGEAHRPDRETFTKLLTGLANGENVNYVELESEASRFGMSYKDGIAVVVIHAHLRVPAEQSDRAQFVRAVEQSANGFISRSLLFEGQRDGRPLTELVVVLPVVSSGRSAKDLAHHLQTTVSSRFTLYSLAVGYSRHIENFSELAKGITEARLAANVVASDDEHVVLAFDDLGAYRLLLSAMSDDPHALRQFYKETLEPLTAYDTQYETDLVQTVERFLDNDGNVAATAQTLYTHRHTVRYRLERVRELTGLDIHQSEGREKLGLGLKVMRVLGLATPRPSV